MEMGTILIAIFVFVLIKGHSEQRAKERARKLQLLEDAIKSGNVDRDLVQELAATFSGKRPQATRPPAEQRPRGTWFLALGWVGIFVGLGIAGLGSFDTQNEELVGAGLLVSLISFGITTYPFALRELEARRRA